MASKSLWHSHIDRIISVWINQLDTLRIGKPELYCLNNQRARVIETVERRGMLENLRLLQRKTTSQDGILNGWVIIFYRFLTINYDIFRRSLIDIVEPDQICKD